MSRTTALWILLVLAGVLPGESPLFQVAAAQELPASQEKPFIETIQPEHPHTPFETFSKLGMFPASVTEGDAVPREMLAVALTQAFGYRTEPISNFPTFRDVPIENPAYPAIEKLREKKILGGYQGGFFKPEKAATRLETYEALSKILRRVKITDAQATYFLATFKDADAIAEESREAVARIVYLQVLTPEQLQSEILAVDTLLTYGELANMLDTLLEHVHDRIADLQNPQAVVAHLPPGLVMEVSPTAALFEARLTAGDRLYFSLAAPLVLQNGEALPEGSRLSGSINAASQAAPETPVKASTSEYMVTFSELKTPDDKTYKFYSRLLLVFPPGSKENFLVPGQVFTIQTLTPPAG